MPEIKEVYCDKCGIKLPPGWGGMFYVTSSLGERYICPHPGEFEYVAQILNFSDDDRKLYDNFFLNIFKKPKWWWSASKKEHQMRIKEAFDKRTGFLSDCICETCLEVTSLDLDKDKRQCPKCGSKKVMSVIELRGKSCFRCVSGMFVEHDTDIVT